MNEFEINLIETAFKRCFGLKESFIEAFRNEDKNNQTEVVNTLSYQSGLRKNFIRVYLPQIQKL